MMTDPISGFPTSTTGRQATRRSRTDFDRFSATTTATNSLSSTDFTADEDTSSPDIITGSFSGFGFESIEKFRTILVIKDSQSEI
jgi:hypothetical protein